MNAQQQAQQAVRTALAQPNVGAFLRVIRAGETGQGDEAYRTMFGGARFESFDDHPRQKVTRGTLTSTAAGAYQFLSRTWDECRAALGLADFGPASQDQAAVFLIHRRGALVDVLAGRLEAAIAKCCREWASLPGSPYGQPTMTLEKARAVYEQYGGVIGQAHVSPPPAADQFVAAEPAPAPPPPPAPALRGEAEPPELQALPAPAPPIQEQPMAPILAGLGKAVFTQALPQVVAAIPKLASIFSSGSEVSQRNVQALEIVASTIGDAVGAANAQQAVEALKDPELAARARAAIDASWSKIHEAHEASLGAARQFVAQRPDRIVVWNMQFHEVLALLMIVLSAGGALAALFFSNLSDEMKGAIVTLMLIGGWTGIKEFYFGGSRGSDRKTELLGSDARQ